MQKYTTGEVAKLCGVSVRTVQYYDTRGILAPSELSDGGRRLYSEDDVSKMRIICFLREIGLPLGSIDKLLAEDSSSEVVSILLEQHEQVLRAELGERQTKLDMLGQIRRELKGVKQFSLETMGDIAHIVDGKKKLTRLRALMITVGIIMEIIEIGSAVLWWQTGIWLPFALGMCVIAALAVWISVYYFRHVAYVCPHCHKIFKPTLKQAFWAYHTPKARRLTCPKCSAKSLCVEVWGTKDQDFR